MGKNHPASWFDPMTFVAEPKNPSTGAEHVRGWNRLWSFLFIAEQDNWLTILRVGFGLQMAAYCVSLRSSWSYFLSGGANHLIGRNVSEAFTTMQSAWIPKVSWLLSGLQQLQIDEQTALAGIWYVLLVGAVCLIAGLFCRTAAALCWFLHLCVTKSGGPFSYGVDAFMTIGLFYLMLSPFPDRWALDARLWKAPKPDPAYLGFFRHVLQIHLCIIYFFGGLTKALGSGWWDGTNLWVALTRPPFTVIPPAIVARFGAWLPLLGICVWLLEITYPIMIWPNRTRLLWLVMICAMHFGIGFAMGMPLFAFVMIVMNVAAFGPASAAESTSETFVRPQPAGSP
jgi:vitamin K-dependent gamma-carboxylase-like protein